jgi:hypothetical protein
MLLREHDIFFTVGFRLDDVMRADDSGIHTGGASLLLLITLAKCHYHWHYESMAIQINIRDVPEKVRDELAARAALQGKSMQEFLRAELERLAARPSIDAWLQQVRKRKRATQTRISAKQILENRNADRR